MNPVPSFLNAEPRHGSRSNLNRGVFALREHEKVFDVSRSLVHNEPFIQFFFHENNGR